MSRPRVALLLASFDEENTRRNFRRELDAEVVEFAANQGELPETFDFDGVVITGSGASVYDGEEWICSLIDWVRRAHERSIPTLGVCFGHQVVAEALGGTVESMGEYEIGYRSVERTGESLLLSDLDDEFTVFTTHRDAVTELPPGADLTAENEFGVHGFRKDDAFAVQFHPEYDMRTAEELTRRKELEQDRRQRVLDGITPENYAAACEAKQLFDAFVDHVCETRVAAAD